ncbi:PolC-type DNA polymerase III [Lactobacillus sp. CC-MHH1034]|uniref:PolC-type DNA polymerase III n=1 Tax=Agrilactobacillus fermenti TaxID=2586909 RepID=UPI001E2DE317|nr:PolC-type DNA polymerase III [Agrilactobacillus fermenti]MCD2256257.1 PolC-type DNA polymerase III [Agrilactobacillus fermenti]
MSDKNELFEKLLAQIELPTDLQEKPDFKAGTIEKVVVHEKSNQWEFFFAFPKILDFEDFEVFQQLLIHAFENIAKIKFHIQTRTSSFDQHVLRAYWPYVLTHSDLNSQLLKQICDSKLPVVSDRRIILQVENEIIKEYLVKGALGPVETTYDDLGFEKFNITATIDQSASQEKIAAFKQRQAETKQKIQASAKTAAEQKAKAPKRTSRADKDVLLGRKIKADLPVLRMADITEEERSVVVEGYVFNCEVRDLRSGRKLLTLKVTDYSSSFVIKRFSRDTDDESVFDEFQKGMWVIVKGSVQEDTYMRDLTINATDINIYHHEPRQDNYEGEKRVELHLHTNMSMMDATNSISDYAAQAKAWGHTALAVTDHFGLQAFPDAHSAGAKNELKMLYGVEINLVDDGKPLAFNLRDQTLIDSEYVIFDVETTGLSAVYDSIIELAAVKMKDNEVLASFDEFIDPGHPLSRLTTELTSITDDMVRGSKSEAEVMALFREFCGDAILAGHNVTFDIGFLNAAYERNGFELVTAPVIDTLEVSRLLHPEYKNHKLDSLAKKYHIVLEHHHRANSDAETTGYLMYKLLEQMEKRYQTTNVQQLNDHVGGADAYKQSRPHHAVLIAQTQAGLKNMFKIVSESMVHYFYREPRVPRSLLNKYRAGLLVGSGCDSGEVFTAMMQKGHNEALELAKYYDYLEVMPKAVYQPLLDRELIKDNAALEDIIQNIIKIGQELDKPVVATGDVHYLNKEDHIYREILIKSLKGSPLARQQLPDVHFRTTEEMLEAFSFLDEATAKKIVITNTHKIVDLVDEAITPVKDKLYTPKMPGAEDEIRSLSMNKAHELYGEPLPEIVEARLQKELNSVIGNGFSVIYLISQKLVYKSNKDGYLVGSRGSVGSSLVATMTGITEVNPLPPHYRCPNCKYSEFYTKGEVGSGFDLPDKKCPNCGAELIKDGHDIPFETFLGFKGDKVPDIDLNFSGDYQPVAHNYTKVLFGEDHVFRAGTIGTVADKTAFGYVKHYEEETEQNFRNAEIERLALGATGVKRTTGQHPAGIIVVPDYMDIYDFTPIQYPADDQNAAWKTTHFDFHSIHDNILKLDILGHDDPTMIRMLQDLSGVEPKSIPTDDPGVMSLFSNPDILGVTPEQIQSKTGTLGIPEFGTRFVRGMLEETHPTTFAELLQISGLSHGTDVWLGNAEELINKGVVTLKEVIGCRDNIMMDLIHWGMDSQMAFQIMEHVRKGRGIPDDWQTAMRANPNVPAWYIDSCLKIKYMFPKAHATAYILMALRIAYFKVYFPIVYYCAYLSVRADDYDLVAMSSGKEAVKARMKEINDKGLDASQKEKNLLTVLEIANECLERDIQIKMVDINKSDAQDFIILDDHTLLAPFNAVPSLGDNVAKKIVSAREEQPFLSKEDLANRGGVSTSLIQYLTDNHVLDDLPDENQLSLF